MPNKKAPSNLNFNDFLAAAKERPEQFQSGLKTLGAINDKFGAAQRAAIAGAQTAGHPMQVLEAAKAGFMGQPEAAPTWQDIAKKAGVDNKYGLAAAGLVGPLLEMDALPGPNLGAAKKEGKAVWNELAPTLQNLNKESKLTVKGGLANTAGNVARQGAKAEQELMAAQKVAPQGGVPEVLSFNLHKAKEQSKREAVEALKAELSQPHLKDAASDEYKRERLQQLFKHLMSQKGY